MRYTLSINTVKCQEWDINLAQGALFDLINQASSWAKACVVDGEVYYWMSRNKIIEEIPVAYTKTDTVYRSLKTLVDKGLIDYIKEGKKDLIRMTEKGRTWNVKGTTQGDAKLGNKSELAENSEINPSKLGNKSEKTPENSEINPTYKSTNNKSINNKNRATHAPDNFLPSDNQVKKMIKYGLLKNDQELLVESFLANSKSKGLTYKCWASALTTWINNEIKFNKLVPLSEKPFKIDDEDWSNPNAPANYQNTGYHPSHQLDKPVIDTRPSTPVVGDPNWHWKEPLPGMSIPNTEKYLKANKRKGENANKAYQRLLAEMQGEAV